MKGGSGLGHETNKEAVTKWVSCLFEFGFDKRRVFDCKERGWPALFLKAEAEGTRRTVPALLVLSF